MVYSIFSIMPSCDLCNIRLSSESLLEGHIRGKRHQQRMAKHNALQSLARRSVFLSKFIHPVSEEQVEESLREYGKVERVILDRNLSSFAIVEFSDEKIASWLVNDVKSIRIGQVALIRVCNTSNSVLSGLIISERSEHT